MHPLPRDDQLAAEAAALDLNMLRSWPLPLDDHGDKFTRGTILVVAGSINTAGAALLAGTAALRMGAGRLQIATAEPITVPLSVAIPEAMVLPLAVDGNNELRSDHVSKALSDPIAAAQAVLVGPGMIGPDAIGAIVEQVVKRISPEAIFVVDAAAIPAITALDRTARNSIAKHLLLTPNRDELDDIADSLGIDKQIDVLMEASSQLGAVITCFGDVASYDGRRWQASPAKPGLGTSGSGDVLAGLAAGAAARCGDPAQAGCWATYVHGAAGSQLSERDGTVSFVARELLDEVPHVLAKLD
jgi:ADP-dependent NAD(P)H-hydrate dehydratase